MKKIDPAYFAKWYGGALLIALVMILIASFAQFYILYLAAPVFLIVALFVIPGRLEKKMSKSALELEKEFDQKGFSYQHKFTSNSGVFYIDLSGRLGVVWKHNPKELSFANLANVTNIHTHDGKMMGGTALVSCRFQLDGRSYKIYTLRVSNGSLSMKSLEVQEAIAKANQLCQMLNAARQNAVSSEAAQG